MVLPSDTNTASLTAREWKRVAKDQKKTLGVYRWRNDQCLDVEMFRKVRNRRKITFNDVMMAGLSGALRRYDRKIGSNTLRRVLVLVAFKLHQSNMLHNDTGGLIIDVGVQEDTVRNRLIDAARVSNSIRTSFIPLITLMMVKAMSLLLPSFICRLLFQHLFGKIDLMLSKWVEDVVCIPYLAAIGTHINISFCSVPGPTSPVSIGGREISNISCKHCDQGNLFSRSILLF